MFEPIGNLVVRAAKVSGLQKQTVAGIVVERAKKKLAEEFAKESKYWTPKKYVEKTLYIKVKNSSSAAALYLSKEAVMEHFQKDEVLEVVKGIEIMRTSNSC